MGCWHRPRYGRRIRPRAGRVLRAARGSVDPIAGQPENMTKAQKRLGNRHTRPLGQRGDLCPGRERALTTSTATRLPLFRIPAAARS